MEVEEVDRVQKKRGWFWAIAFLLFAAVYISDGLTDPANETMRLLAGVGMLLVVPHAFLSPRAFSSYRMRPANLTGWLAAAWHAAGRDQPCCSAAGPLIAPRHRALAASRQPPALVTEDFLRLRVRRTG